MVKKQFHNHRYNKFTYYHCYHRDYLPVTVVGPLVPGVEVVPAVVLTELVGVVISVVPIYM